MTTTFVADNRTELDQCDSTSGWTATDGPTLFTTDPAPIELTGYLGMQVSNADEDAYTSITSDDYSGGGSLSVWMQERASLDTTANVGFGIVLGDGTDRVAYSVGSDTVTGFRHETGPVKWANFILDPANLPGDTFLLAGVEANLTLTAITQVGVYFNTTVKSVGGTENCFWDVLRWANPGDDVVFVGGTTAGAAGNGSETAAIDRDNANQRGLGVLRELASGVYGIQGNITLGDTASSSNQFWEETNVTYAWEDRALSSANYYRFNLVGSSTATTCSFIFTATTFVVPSSRDALFDGNGADIDVCTMDGCVFIGFTNTTGIGVETSDDTGDEWTNCSFISCDRVDANGCNLSGSSFLTSEVAADEGALFWDLNSDPDTDLDGCTFSQGTADHHAIRFGTNIPTTDITLRNCAFNGFSSSDDVNGSTFRFDDTSGTLNLNLINCTVDGNPASESNIGVDDAAGVTVTLVIDPVDTMFTVVLEDMSVVQNARVFAETGDVGGGAGTSFPYQAATTSLTQSGGTATCDTSANHLLTTGDQVVVRGAQPDGYNKVATITVTDANTFTYSVDSGLSSPATGTPVVSYVPVHGLTDVNGEISSSKTWPASQSVIGWARNSSTTPLTSEGAISVADASSGTDLQVTLPTDE